MTDCLEPSVEGCFIQIGLMYIAEGLFDALKKEPLQMFLVETLNRNTPCEHHGHVCLTSSSPLRQFFI